MDSSATSSSSISCSDDQLFAAYVEQDPVVGPPYFEFRFNAKSLMSHHMRHKLQILILCSPFFKVWLNLTSLPKSPNPTFWCSTRPVAPISLAAVFFKFAWRLEMTHAMGTGLYYVGLLSLLSFIWFAAAIFREKALLNDCRLHAQHWKGDKYSFKKSS